MDGVLASYNVLKCGTGLAACLIVRNGFRRMCIDNLGSEKYLFLCLRDLCKIRVSEDVGFRKRETGRTILKVEGVDEQKVINVYLVLGVVV
jgi:hypothetical protein